MESWLQRLVLAILVATSAPTLLAADEERTILDDVISPEIERRKIDDDKLDTESLEIGFYAGVLSVEDFGSNDVYGGRMALYVTEDVFLEGNIGFSNLQETSYETLSGETKLLSEDERQLTYYNLNLGLNLFPGEIYLGRWAFNSNFYIVGGAGNTNFADNEYFTYQFGGGFRLFATDWLSLHVDFRNHVLEHGIFGEEKKIQNLESHVGLSLFL